MRVCLLMCLLAAAVTAFLPGSSMSGSGPRISCRRYSRACACTADEEQDWENYEWWEDGLTCVEFTAPNDDALRLGVYKSYSMLVDTPHIVPLCASSEEDGISALLCDEDLPVVPLSAVHRILDPDYVFVSERQAGGGQGLGNPHGEHGEECYDLREVEVSEFVQVVVREGRDTERVL